MITEFLASNQDGIADFAGDQADWIELWNPTSAPVDLTGYRLSDDMKKPAKWVFPQGASLASGNYLLVFASGKDVVVDGEYHTNFKLNASGESLTLSDPNGNVLSQYGDASAGYPQQTSDVSYGIVTEPLDTTEVYFATPTPNGPNHHGLPGLVADTKFSVDRGYFVAPFELQLTSETKGATLVYTVDGSEPAPTHGISVPASHDSTPPTAVVTIGSTSTVRVMAFKPGWLATNVDTATYLFPADVVRQTGVGLPDTWGHEGADYAMDPTIVDGDRYRDEIVDDLMAIPSLSLVTDLDNWFGKNGVGIYPNGSGSERPVSAELLRADGSAGFQIDAAVEIQGGSSTNRWKSDKLSMQLKFKSEFGAAKLDYPLFGPERATTFDTLVLDARLNQAWHYGGEADPTKQRASALYARDQFVADLQNLAGGRAPAGQPVHLYLNGIYWGLYNLHERPDEHFAADYLGGDSDDYDVIKHNHEVVQGSIANYNTLLRAANRDLSQDRHYAVVVDMLDIDQFIDYLLINLYVGNEDWAHHNWYATFDKVSPTGRWRFHSWDAEHVLKTVDYDATTKDDVEGPTHLHQRLAANKSYRLRFADHVQRHFFGEGVLTPSKTVAVFQTRLDAVYQAVVPESARWGDNRRSRPYTRDVEWIAERERLMTSYFPQRTDIVLNQLRRQQLYPALAAPTWLMQVANQLELTAARGQIVFTLDGSDPVDSATAMIYAGTSLDVTHVTVVNVRSQLNSTWSALVKISISQPPDIVGDFNANARLDSADLDVLFQAIRDSSDLATFDLTGDAVVDSSDAVFWVETLARTKAGDADLDGQVQFTDFVVLAQNFGNHTATWSQGDFDGDGTVQFADFVVLATNFGFNNAQPAAAPLPGSVTLESSVLGDRAIATRVARRGKRDSNSPDPLTAADKAD